MQGSQRPRLCSLPAYAKTAGKDAVELAARAGLHLDPWEAFVLENSLGTRPDGLWAAFEVGLIVSRQNGKGAILEARELAGLFLFEERLIVHSSHQFDTSLEAFRRLLMLIEQTPELDRRVKRVSRSHGEEGIELKGGRRIRFRTRTKGGGRGFTADLLILDEAMFLPEFTIGALLPTLAARPNPQVWYTGSSVDQLIHDDGIVLARVRDRGLKSSPRLAFFEWSVDRKTPADVDEETARDLGEWGTANPGLGIRISAEHIENERRSMDPRTFAVERLGVGDWPSLDGEDSVISKEAWNGLADDASAPVDPIVFAFDVSPDRSSAAIAVAGARADGLKHIEITDHHRGTGWVVERVVELIKAHEPVGVFCDSVGPASSLVADLEREHIEVTLLNGSEHAKGCGMLYDLVQQNRLRHLGTSELGNAVAGAVKRPLGESWAWSRKNSTVDICPLVACTLALYGHLTVPTTPEPMFSFV